MAADEKWYFAKEQLANSPSRKCGIDADKELSNRQQAANFIQDMGQRLVVYPFIYTNKLSTHLFTIPQLPSSYHQCFYILNINNLTHQLSTIINLFIIFNYFLTVFSCLMGFKLTKSHRKQ